MKKLPLLMVSLLVIINLVGCTGANLDSQSTKVGTLILNQEQVKTIDVVKEGSGEPAITISDTNRASELISKVKEIPVRKLSKDEEINFMPKRMLDVPFLTVMFYSDNSHKILNGQFLIWPDGYICALDVNSMTGSQRTISYLSESKYPEIYKWISDSVSASKLSTQFEAAEQFVKSQGYQIMMNSGANVDIELPGSFSEIKYGIKIGELLKKRNEISSKSGLDFAAYLGKQITYITYGVESKNNITENINLLLDGDKVIGFWVDNGEPPDFSLIRKATQVSK